MMKKIKRTLWGIVSTDEDGDISISFTNEEGAFFRTKKEAHEFYRDFTNNDCEETHRVTRFRVEEI